MGAERLVMLLSWVLVLSGPTDWRWGKVEVSTMLRPGVKCGGLESKLDGDLDPLTEVERVGLICS